MAEPCSAPAEARPPEVPVAEPCGASVEARQAESAGAVAAAPSSAAVPFPVRAHAAVLTARRAASVRQAQGPPQGAKREVRPRAAAHEARPQGAEPRDAAVEVPTVVAVVALPGAAAAAEPDVGVGPGRVAAAGADAGSAALRVVPAASPSALPWAAAWACPRSPVLLSAAPPRSVRFAHAMGSPPVAWPSMRSWQAALVVALSCALDPGEVLEGGRGGDRKELNQQTPAINRQALGRIVAGIKREHGFICGTAPLA